jgi:hypothetical protein
MAVVSTGVSKILAHDCGTPTRSARPSEWRVGVTDSFAWVGAQGAGGLEDASPPLRARLTDLTGDLIPLRPNYQREHGPHWLVQLRWEMP